jgi:hypothetical protein
MPRKGTKAEYEKLVNKALAAMKAKGAGGCATTTDDIPCDNKPYDRTFGVGVPHYGERNAPEPKKKWIGRAVMFFHLRAHRKKARASYPWVHESEDDKYKGDPLLPKGSPAESRKRGLRMAVALDPDLEAEIAAWKKKIKCETKPECRGPEVIEEKETLGGDLDVSQYGAFTSIVRDIFYVGVCIKMKFKCKIVGPTTPPQDRLVRPPQKEDVGGADSGNGGFGQGSALESAVLRQPPTAPRGLWENEIASVAPWDHLPAVEPPLTDTLLGAEESTITDTSLGSEFQIVMAGWSALFEKQAITPWQRPVM